MANSLLTMPRFRTSSWAEYRWFWSLLCRVSVRFFYFFFYQSVVQDEIKSLSIRWSNSYPCCAPQTALVSRRVFVPHACRSGKLFGWLRGRIFTGRQINENTGFFWFSSLPNALHRDLLFWPRLLLPGGQRTVTTRTRVKRTAISFPFFNFFVRVRSSLEPEWTHSISLRDVLNSNRSITKRVHYVRYHGLRTRPAS